MRTRREMMLCVVAAAGLSACATAPTQQLGEAQGTVSAAEAVGAQETPRAAYHLELARQQIAAARPLVDGGRSDKRAAERLLVRAETDAVLAMQIARTEEMRSDAKEAWADVNQLQGESGAATSSTSSSTTKSSSSSTTESSDESSMEESSEESMDESMDEGEESMEESSEPMSDESPTEESSKSTFEHSIEFDEHGGD